MPNTSRPLTCTCVKRSADKFFCSELLDVCTGVTSAVTSTVCVTPPTLSVIFPRSRVSPDSTGRPLVSISLNPSMWTLRSYVAGVSEANLKTPCGSVTAVRDWPLLVLVTVTVAPGTTPSLSATVPRTVAVACAYAEATPTRLIKTRAQPSRAQLRLTSISGSFPDSHKNAETKGKIPPPIGGRKTYYGCSVRGYLSTRWQYRRQVSKGLIFWGVNPKFYGCGPADWIVGQRAESRR